MLYRLKSFPLLFLLVALCFHSYAQQLAGRVIDAQTKTGLPFATVKINEGKEGTVADLNGYFIIHTPTGSFSLQATYLGYETATKQILPHTDSIIIALAENNHALKEFVVKPPYDKIKRILNQAIAHRPKNNPDNYDWYRCHVYYKMVFDIRFQDAMMEKMEKDTSKDAQFFASYVRNQDVFMTETYSTRTWQKPQQLQEEILASKMSGFKKSLFNGLVTDVLPFHSYTDYLSLNGKDYHNPVSKGWQQRYSFHIVDEIWSERDTIWVLSFQPKNNSIPPLKGRVYIHSNGFAIANLLAESRDTNLKRTIKVEQQYRQVNGKWFPKELNYILEFDRQQIDKAVKSKDSAKRKPADTVHFVIVATGNSKIDSVSFDKDTHFKFDKTHTLKLAEKADEANDSIWLNLRPIPLTEKEKRTYVFDDSLFTALKINKFVPLLEKLTEAKLPIKYFDINLDRVWSYNRYENSRWGLGIETNESLSKHFSVGVWTGYGIRDASWKYGGFTTLNLDRYKDFSFSIAYEHTLQEPGRIFLSPEIDNNYIHRLLMNKADAVNSFSLALKKRAGYWNMELGGRYEEIAAKYAYTYTYGNIADSQFINQELSMKLRYAFAERRVPVFNQYYNSGTKYPVLYAKISCGNVLFHEHAISYQQAVASVYWKKHINRVGNENFMITTGKTWSDEPLPLSKLFAANGFKYDQNTAYYFFGGLFTMQPDQYFSDRFVHFCWKHDFDKRLYNIGFSAPYLSVAYNMLWGNMDHQSAQQNIEFKTAEKGYSEAGLILNSILRLKYLGLYYITTNVGYFAHIKDELDLSKNSSIVIGIGVDL